MVIMDECHHGASSQAQRVLQRVRSKYVFGVSATPVRSDHLEKILYMLLGPIRHRYTVSEKMKDSDFRYFVLPRFTRLTCFHQEELDINDAYELAAKDEMRNQMLLQDAEEAVKKNRAVLILTRLKTHAKHLHEQLQGKAENVYLIYGDQTVKENWEVRDKLQKIDDSQSVILIATGQKVGEGFDFPRLDTLLLAAPLRFDGRLLQYLGRLDRQYPGKKDVIIYDYVDHHIRFFANQYKHRLKTYKRIGYRVLSELNTEKQNTQAIFDAQDYQGVFEQDLLEAGEEIVICSLDLCYPKIGRFLEVIHEGLDSGLRITVITQAPGSSLWMASDASDEMIMLMKKNGISVITVESLSEHFALIDRSIVWYGGMNLLGKVDVWDNLIRIKSPEVAMELAETVTQQTVSAKDFK
ncbi:MAG: DEAD/DEAH box helicase family protein [Erysipelotrichaceae bacterium]|nr:DEAD/DEAH box helicase family protein [Erysipelotrichaceae bacterium]